MRDDAMNTVKYCALTAAAGLLLSCSTSGLGWKAEKDAAKRSKNAYIEDFDPATLHDDDITVTPVDAAQPQTDAVPAHDTVSEAADMEEMIQGYRVQLLATKDEAMAREEMRKAMMTFDQKVYLEYEAPYYKLRIGDFASRKEAETYKESVVRTGIRDKEKEWQGAWIVPSKVNIR